MRTWDFQPHCQAGDACMLERRRAVFSETGLEAGRGEASAMEKPFSASQGNDTCRAKIQAVLEVAGEDQNAL